MIPAATPFEAWIDSVALIGPGLAHWPAAREMLRGEQPWHRAATVATLPPVLPPAERRRTSLAVRIALAAGHSAIAGSSFRADHLASVFASSGGDGLTCHLICEALVQEDRRISPTHFHNSVHNAPSGYWGIAMRSTAASTSVCGHDGSFAAGLLEAMMQLRAGPAPVILVAYDAPYPDPLHACRPVADAFGVALVLSPHATGKALMRMSMTLCEAPSTRMSDEGLESMRLTIPSARSLPLLQALALEQSGRVVIDYLDPPDPRLAATRLCLELAPPAASGAAASGGARSADGPGQLDHDAIAARVPHAGPMCLLDRVLSWDADHLECTARPSAGAVSHPLAQDGRLPATAAIEYAAQAMALHGGLVQERAAQEEVVLPARPADTAGRQGPRRGFLAGLRKVRLHTRWIDSESPLLAIRVERFAGDDVQVLYDFEVRGDGLIAQGRAVVVLDAAARAASRREAPRVHQ